MLQARSLTLSKISGCIRSRLLVSIATVILLAVPVHAQGVPGTGSIGSGGGSQPVSPSGGGGIPSVYKITRGGQSIISVNLWGYVGNPGHFEVPTSTSLVELLSFAGGPSAQARLVDIRVIHADTAAGETRVQVYNIERYRDEGDLSQNPLLVPGDTIIVSGRALEVFFQAVSIITNIIVIVTALINFISFTKK